MANILVIDDEPDLVRFVARALEADGHAVTTSTGGSAGLQAALSPDLDLVVLDLLMPGVDGRAVLGGVLAVRPDAKVLVLSAISEVGTKVDCLERGAVDYLNKPFAIRELVARVRLRLGDTQATRTEPHLRVGDIMLDTRRHELHIGGRVTALSPRESTLLQHFMRKADRVCTRSELLSAVWGYGFDTETNVVDVYVARLRHKLRADVIQTIRNVGYQLQSG